jgi:hypothetical protein
MVTSSGGINMKKFILLGLALLLLGSAIFADDAKVMPKRVGRFYLAPTYSFASGAYDANGDKQSFSNGSMKLFNLGAALEYGITDWFTGAIQWAPGWTPWSDIKAAVPVNRPGDLNVNGVADIFVGAKIQLVGEKAPLLQTEAFRFAVAPGVIIPLPGPNFKDEVANAMAGKEATFNKMDNHVFGAGGRFYFDWIINKYFFINLYNETIFYPVKQDLNKDGPTFAMTKASLPSGVQASVNQALTQAGDPNAAAKAAAAKAMAEEDLKNASGEVNYKYKLTFEIEPIFSTPIADGLIFSAGLPVNYLYIPAYEYSISKVGTSLSAFGLDTKKLMEDQFKGDAAYTLSIKPNVSLFLTKTLLPLEFKFQYQLPVMGQNSIARNNLTLQIKAYFKI